MAVDQKNRFFPNLWFFSDSKEDQCLDYFQRGDSPFCNDWKMSRGHLRVHSLFEPSRNVLSGFCWPLV